MAKFAKLFETASGQLLVAVQAEDEDGLSPLTIRTEERHGIIPEVSIRYATMDECDAALAAFDQEKAENQAASMTRMVDCFAA